MADADRIQLTYAEETGGYAVKPGGNWQIARLLSESLRQDDQTTRSATLRADRQIVDHVRTNANVAGDIVTELSYGTETSAWLEAVMLSSDWTTAAAANTGTFSSDNTTSKFTGTGIHTNLTAGDIIEARGFSAVVDGFYQVTVVGTDEITVSPPPPTPDVTGDADEEIHEGAMITNGTEQRSFHIEKEFTDNTNDFALYSGVEFDSLSLATANEQIVQATWTVLGSTESSAAATSAGTPVAAPAFDVFNAVDNIPPVKEGAPAGGGTIAAVDLQLTLANNLRGRTQIGSLGPQSIGTGKCEVSGTLQMYYSDSTLIDKHLDKTESSLIYGWKDAAGNAFAVFLPSIKYLSAQRVAGGENTDILADVSFSARVDPTPVGAESGYTIRFARFPA